MAENVITVKVDTGDLCSLLKDVSNQLLDVSKELDEINKKYGSDE